MSTGQGFVGNNMFTYCLNNSVNGYDPFGEAGLLFAFIASTVVAGVANAISTAISSGSVEECIVSGLIGAGSAAIGFGVALATGFTPAGNIAARAAASTICDLGTTWYRNGTITSQDVAATVVDVTIDVCFSTVTYYYTDPIKDFGKQTLLNSSIDVGVDISETILFSLQSESSTEAARKSVGGTSPILKGAKNAINGALAHKRLYLP